MELLTENPLPPWCLMSVSSIAFYARVSTSHAVPGQRLLLCDHVGFLGSSTESWAGHAGCLVYDNETHSISPSPCALECWSASFGKCWYFTGSCSPRSILIIRTPSSQEERGSWSLIFESDYTAGRCWRGGHHGLWPSPHLTSREAKRARRDQLRRHGPARGVCTYQRMDSIIHCDVSFQKKNHCDVHDRHSHRNYKNPTKAGALPPRKMMEADAAPGRWRGSEQGS